MDRIMTGRVSISLRSTVEIIQKAVAMGGSKKKGSDIIHCALLLASVGTKRKKCKGSPLYGS